jgi:ubiquinone/menaquinone biosynthesis C-methylase UbiE
MERKPEPELMETAEQVEAYANADFAVPHSRVIELFREVFPGAEIAGAVLDAGCGTGDISVRFARAFPHCRVTGVDGSTAMLKKGAEILSREPAELRTQVALIQGLLPDAPVTPQAFATILSNSLLHHLHDPQVMWKTVRNFACPGARVFIVDLMRPDNEETARHLTALYCAGEPAVLRRDFFNSLLAAFTPEEIREQLLHAGFGHFNVRAVSDRHVMVWGEIPDGRTIE